MGDDRKIVGEDIKDVEFSWPIGMPLCRSLGDGLWEVRSGLTQGRIARVLFCVLQGRMVLLHAFVKMLSGRRVRASRARVQRVAEAGWTS